MNKWHDEFEYLRRQWSDSHGIDENFRYHNGRKIAKIGVAWVVEFPNGNFSKPVGWEVEIIDSPVGISERTNKLLKWLRHPPASSYDNIYSFDDGSDIILKSHFDQYDSMSRNNYIRSLTFNQPKQRFIVPPNEYEVFKKTCCECRDKSFKNSSTDSESKQSDPYMLTEKYSHLSLPPEKFPKTKSSNRSNYTDVEQELNNQPLDVSGLSFDFSNDTPRSPIESTPRHNNNYPDTPESSFITKDLLDTHKTIHDLASYHPSLKNIYEEPYAIGNLEQHPLKKIPPKKLMVKDLEQDKTINNETIPSHNRKNNGTPEANGKKVDDHIKSIIENEIIKKRLNPTHNQQTNVFSFERRTNKARLGNSPNTRTVGSHISSVDINDGTIANKGSSLEQYANTERVQQSTTNDSDFEKPKQNDCRRHHHRRRECKGCCVDATRSNNNQSVRIHLACQTRRIEK